MPESNLTGILFKNKYDEEPVHYCAHCLSLAVRILNDSTDYCDKCGCTHIASASIDHWNALYQLKYGHKFLKEK